MILALAGGVGGAKLAHGLAQVLEPDELIVAVNTGDDFEHLGLHVSPDLDTVTYTLAGIANSELGWGVEGESWAFMEMLGELGDDTWFRLGDRDLAVHVHRTRRLHAGESLTDITADMCRHLGVRHSLVPMSEDSVQTMCISGERVLAFQEYFVRHACEPVVDRFEYRGAGEAALSVALQGALVSGELEGVIICPSNPYLSVGPILAVGGLRERLHARSFPILAVSPLIGGAAVKGPAAKIFRELGKNASALGIAEYYDGVIDMLVIDAVDERESEAIRRLGIEPVVAPILMKSSLDRERLARLCVSRVRSRAKHAA